MLRLGLYQPEIPPNTGNIMRLCANTGSELHLVRPLGFALDDRRLRRAGLDYRDRASLKVHDGIDALLADLRPPRVWALSSRARHCYTSASFRSGDLLLFGPETRGLPRALLERFGDAQCLRIPMLPDSRSLNLSNAAALVLYEGLRQLGFPGLA